MLTLVGILIQLIGQTLCWFRLAFRSTQSIMAENLFLRRQLALYVERGVKSRRVDQVTRISLVLLSRLFRLAGRPGGGAPRDDDPLAPGRLEAVLAPEVSTRPAAPPEQVQALIHRMGIETRRGARNVSPTSFF